MNIKSFISNKKKILISCIACFLIGGGIAFAGNVPDQEISDMQAKNTEIAAQISQKNVSLESDKKDLDKLKNNLSEYQTKKDDIDKAKEEKLAKEQEEKEKKEQAEAEAAKKKQEAEVSKSVAPSSNSRNADNTKSSDNKQVGAMVWRTKTGKKYHSTSHCGNTHSAQATEITLSEAQAEGLTPCSKCY
ncbi:hypothetical protein K5V21_12935 [Clostridium sardiniense]|uniref:Metallo beta-lactamase family protein n=1 Tax=Clostridium sardiniense TaxID=29369 RepID=A0ABS7KZW9_CLOSR|nr:hypothetical protein [Clostridium sardiniense]MBY0756354.1 hypothetical protein [Clostridium sardiniense]MDQ0461511.1 site-specific DNA-cytosine methylase [Clostridium sardiniense]